VKAGELIFAGVAPLWNPMKGACRSPGSVGPPAKLVSRCDALVFVSLRDASMYHEGMPSPSAAAWVSFVRV
jgi:hypothetical protein